MSKEKKRKNGIKTGKRSRNQKKKLKGVLTACIVILVLLVIGLIAYEIVVNTKTMGGNITVNGANVSRLTPEKASETLSSAFESKQLTYVENGNTVYTVTLGNLGYSLAPGGSAFQTGTDYGGTPTELEAFSWKRE